MPDVTPWTADVVGRRLVEAFRLLPGRPVMSSARGSRSAAADVDPFAWPARYLADDRDRRLVLAWARCGATGESFAALCRAFGWSSLNPARRRRAALAAIAAGLDRDHPARSTS